nr:hypothetical protein [Mucilaginibacter sp. X4EP1]
MKSVIYYLVAIYIGSAFLSIYSYIADIIADPSFSLHHLGRFFNYLVYFILYKTWLLGLILPCYALIFYKDTGMEHIFYKISFIIVLSVCLTAVYIKKDLCFVERPKNIRLFAIYFFTGFSLLGIHIRYWHKKITE